jgi:hypothetical protein
MAEKQRTIDLIKQTRKAAPEAVEARRLYINMRKAIAGALGDEAKTIPQVAEAARLPVGDVTYYMMAMLKFGELNVTGIDDMDEYYFYELKKN